MDLGKMAAKPIEMKVGDQMFKVSPITVGDLADFEQYIKQIRLNQFLETAKNVGMKDEMKMEMISRMLNRPFTNDDFSTELSTMSGIRYMVWRGIVKNHPKITLDDVSKIEDLNEVMEVINAISAIGRIAENPSVTMEEKAP